MESEILQSFGARRELCVRRLRAKFEPETARELIKINRGILSLLAAAQGRLESFGTAPRSKPNSL